MKKTNTKRPQPADISPLAHVEKGTYLVPTFILLGSADDVVLAEQSLTSEKALRERGAPSGILIPEGESHMYDIFMRLGASNGRTVSNQLLILQTNF